MIFRKLTALLLLLLTFTTSSGQNGFNRFLTPADTLNKKRLFLIAGSWTAIYGGTLVGLNQLWYKNYPRSSFHFFNDVGEWNQVDKIGHCYTSYFEGVWSVNAMKWTGLSEKQAAWYGGLTGSVLQTTIEILDGFSAEWGFSVSDITANTLGSALVVSQQLAWKEQRIQLKFSSHPVSYPAELKQRAGRLYGTTFPEKVIKDYNGQTYWLCVNPSTFVNGEKKFPGWLNVSFGYGAEGMYGGFVNNGTQEGKGESITDVQRIRQFYLSLDVDLTKIKTRSQFLKTILLMANIIKIPFPAIEYNTGNKLVLHPVYF